MSRGKNNNPLKLNNPRSIKPLSRTTVPTKKLSIFGDDEDISPMALDSCLLSDARKRVELMREFLLGQLYCMRSEAKLTFYNPDTPSQDDWWIIEVLKDGRYQDVMDTAHPIHAKLRQCLNADLVNHKA